MADWQPVRGYEGRYIVSDDGRVATTGGKLLRQWPNNQGYHYVRLSCPRALKSVHRLVAIAFCSRPEGCDVVNHKDHDRANNHRLNLEWCTQAHNLSHATAAGRMRRDYWAGKRSPNAKLSDSDAHRIRVEYSAGDISMAALAQKVGASKRTVQKIINGQSYAGAAPR